jgi:hypothetical protein
MMVLGGAGLAGWLTWRALKAEDDDGGGRDPPPVLASP